MFKWEFIALLTMLGLTTAVIISSFVVGLINMYM